MGNLSAVRQRTESIGFSPLRGSHRAARRQKYHYSVMALSYGEAVIHLPSTYRSFPQWEIIAFVTDVAHHHRNVTEECVFSFQGPLPDVAWLAYSITAQIVKCVGLVGLPCRLSRPIFGRKFQTLKLQQLLYGRKNADGSVDFLFGKIIRRANTG